MVVVVFLNECVFETMSFQMSPFSNHSTLISVSYVSVLDRFKWKYQLENGCIPLCFDAKTRVMGIGFSRVITSK